jgi:DNA-binding NarL/FixJ family response regulator
MSTPLIQAAPATRAGLTGVVVFSEQRLVAEGLQALLRTAGGFAVPAVAGSLGHLLDAVHRLRPAVVLLDAGAGGPQGARAVMALRPLRPDVRLVVLADSLDARLAELVAAGHADALLPKAEASGRATVQAIRDVLSGRSVLTGWSARTAPTTGSGLGRLSARQREVLRLVVAGYSNAQIAAELVISVNTVKFHVRSIFRELGTTSRVDAARRYGAMAAGVTAPGRVRVTAG